MAYSKLHPIALGLTVAVMGSISTFLIGLFFNMFFSGKPIASMIGSVYVTYNPSILNSALTALMVFVNALIGGYIAAWIYNLLSDYL